MMQRSYEEDAKQLSKRPPPIQEETYDGRGLSTHAVDEPVVLGLEVGLGGDLFHPNLVGLLPGVLHGLHGASHRLKMTGVGQV